MNGERTPPAAELVREVLRPGGGGRIVLLVLDGLGGLPAAGREQTELEAARTPHLDALAAAGICGLHEPVAPGITPGSGPAHLALFGYDPAVYRVGRGVLSALGLGFELEPGDVAARGNLCTLDGEGRIADRRAGRPPTQKAAELCALLRGIELGPGIELFVEPEKEHRVLVVLRGEGLSGAVSDTDPQRTGVPPLSPAAASTDPAAARTAELVRRLTEQAHRLLAPHAPANGLLLRGFSQRPRWPSLEERFGLRGLGIAAYPMYRGVARLLGMQVASYEGSVRAAFGLLAQRWQEFDFFFVHVKETDAAGEDGDFERKVAVIEEVDAALPQLLALRPEVLVVTGDHSTPAALRSHSWHPVPVVLSAASCRPDPVRTFGERACLAGALGPRLAATSLLPLALAHAGRLDKFGA
ncbi:MAG: putative 2,3-bisphosphoglycerate-independent phosphoglycerate mutase [Planctomycetota bacterium]|nr:MAG: putative 2,3-bisphosphoglycerate-independent phosphoglycerate mutase [Planctomycetota bacterium]